MKILFYPRQSVKLISNTPEWLILESAWSGYLWQGRYASFPMDEAHLLRAAAYVELNPVQAGMVKSAWDYQYSSVHAHLSGKDELDIIKPDQLLGLVDDWKLYLQEAQQSDVDTIQKHTRTGRPMGSNEFIKIAEKTLGRILTKKKTGPKAKKSDN